MAEPAAPKGIRIRWLLLGTNALVLAMPVAVFFGLRIYDTYLLRQTERQLIAQAVFAGEVWREKLAAAGSPVGRGEFRPPRSRHQTFVPIEPLIDLGTPLFPPQPPPEPCASAIQEELRVSAQATVPLLKRAQVFTLSAIRILDREGCVLATTRGELGMSLRRFPEVRQALAGRYGSVTRRRITDEPTPPLVDVRRRGTVRVFAALPVFADGQVIGVVRISRTSLSAARSLWLNRKGLLLALVACGLLIVVTSFVFAKSITRPLARLRTQAKSTARGDGPPTFRQRPWTPVEFKVLGEALASMTDELRERAEYTSAYAAHVTHELKTPITAIRGAAELLRHDFDAMSQEQRERFLDNIGADAVRMERLVNQLLHLTRIENATSTSTAETIDLRTFFEALTSRYSERVTCEVAPGAEEITMDPDHLVSAVTNLVDNALEHDPGSKVRVQVSREKQRVVVRVTDNGPGVPTEHQGRIFDRFFTTKGDQGGTGLGLPLVKAIAEGRGGSVRVDSQPGRTEFTLVV